MGCLGHSERSDDAPAVPGWGVVAGAMPPLPVADAARVVKEPRRLRRGASPHYNADMFGKAQPPAGAAHSIRDEIHGVLIFLAAIWAVFIVSLDPSLGTFAHDHLALEPRTLHGLVGVGAMPFLHANLAAHLWATRVPLLILLMLVAGSAPARGSWWRHRRAGRRCCCGCSAHNRHVGASGLCSG